MAVMPPQSSPPILVIREIAPWIVVALVILAVPLLDLQSTEASAVLGVSVLVAAVFSRYTDFVLEWAREQQQFKLEIRRLREDAAQVQKGAREVVAHDKPQ